MLARVLLVFIVLIAAAHIIGSTSSWYWKFLWLDTVMHLAGGAWTGLFFLYLFGERLNLLNLSKNFLLTAVLSIGFVLLVGVLWEFFEYFRDTYIAHVPQNVPRPHPNLYVDTLKDLMNDFLGSIVSVSLWFVNRKRVKTDS